MKALCLGLILTLLPSFAAADSLRSNCSASSPGVGAVQEDLVGIGFSRDKNVFAYLKQGYSEGVGSYFWEFTVQDLTSGDIVDRFKRLGEQKRQAEPPRDVKAKAGQLLNKYDISWNTDVPIMHFPFVSGDAVVNVQALAGKTTDNNGITETDIDIWLVDEQFNSDKVGTLAKVNFFGHPKLFDHEVIGYVWHEERNELIVVVGYKDQASEDSDIICTYRLFAARLPIEKRSPEEKIRFLEQLISVEPGQTEAYLHLGDSYWTLGRHGRAKNAYRRYLIQIKARPGHGKAPARVAKRVGQLEPGPDNP